MLSYSMLSLYFLLLFKFFSSFYCSLLCLYMYTESMYKVVFIIITFRYVGLLFLTDNNNSCLKKLSNIFLSRFYIYVFYILSFRKSLRKDRHGLIEHKRSIHGLQNKSMPIKSSLRLYLELFI